MIERYTDHAANERTFLAWVRTALAIMAFGCVMTKFELFLRFAAANASLISRQVAGQAADRAFPAPGQDSMEFLGLASVGFGIVLLAGALHRFLRVRADILAADIRPVAGTRGEYILTGILSAAGIALLVLLARS